MRAQPIDDLGGDAPLHDDAARRGALLTGREEGATRDLLRREVEIGVLERDRRILAAELELDALAARRRLRLEPAPDRVRAGERHGRDLGTRHERASDLRALAEDEVEHAARQ